MPELTKDQLKAKLLREYGEGGTDWRRRESVPVAVVVVGHNYGRFLADALESVTEQTPAPKEVVYVDNASDDDSVAVAKEAAIKCATIGAEPGNICACRNRGARMTNAPFLVFLDADDVLPAGYLKLAHDAIVSDERLGFAYPTAHQFGIYEDISGQNPSYTRTDLLVKNFAVCPSIVRRSAFESVGGFDGLPMFHDWDLWLRINRQGYLFRRIPGVTFQVRTHADSMTNTLQGRLPWYQEVLRRQPVTLFTPFGPGRREIHERYLRMLDSLGFDWNCTHVLFYDNTGDEAEGRLLRGFLARSPAKATTYLRDDTQVSYHNMETRAIYVPERMAEIWTRASKHFEGDFLLSLEDDIEPPPGGIRRLYEGLTPDVAAVTGAYYSRPATARTRELALEWYNAKDGALRLKELEWYPGNLTHPPKDGVQTIGATGMGCLLMRRDILDGFTYPTGNSHNWRGQDFGVCRQIKESGKRLLIHWGIRCKHFYSPTEWI